MRQLATQYLQGIFKPTQLVGVVLGIGSVVFLGGGCTKIPQTKTQSAVSSTNTGSDVNVQTNSVGNANLGTNTSIANANSNTNPNSHENTNTSPLDTSDWLTYTNQEYGFSFRYPIGWEVKALDPQHVQLSPKNFTTLPNGATELIQVGLTNQAYGNYLLNTPVEGSISSRVEEKINGAAVTFERGRIVNLGENTESTYSAFIIPLKRGTIDFYLYDTSTSNEQLLKMIVETLKE